MFKMREPSFNQPSQSCARVIVTRDRETLYSTDSLEHSTNIGSVDRIDKLSRRFLQHQGRENGVVRRYTGIVMD